MIPVDGSTVVPGQAIHYTVTVTGDAVGFTNDVVVTDALAGVLAHADVTDISAEPGQRRASPAPTWCGRSAPSAPRRVLTLTYTATVKDDAVGVTLTNTVSATGETNPAACGAACTTTHHTPAWTLAKTSDPATGAVVVPGDTVTYTLTATNTSDAQIIGAMAADDLTGVLADADVTFTSPQLSRSGSTLTWAIPTLAKGEAATVSYSATVKAGADGATLTNTVRPIGAGGSCAGACSTTQGTTRWSLAKTSSPASGAVVKPGDTLTYTLAVTNSGPVPVTGATVTDDVSDLVDDATLGTLPAGITRSGTQLTLDRPHPRRGRVADDQLHRCRQGRCPRRDPAEHRCAGRHRRSLRHFLQHRRDHPGMDAGEDQHRRARRNREARRRRRLHPHRRQHRPGHPARRRRHRRPVRRPRRRHPRLACPSVATLSGSTLTWPVPDVAPGGHTSVSYQATVKAGADGATLRNAAVRGQHRRHLPWAAAPPRPSPRSGRWPRPPTRPAARSSPPVTRSPTR